MNIAIALTAARMGATIANHMEVLSLIKMKNEEGEEEIRGAVLLDRVSGKEYNVIAKCVVNATGPYTDRIRQMADPDVKKICLPSAGVHIVLPEYYRLPHPTEKDIQFILKEIKDYLSKDIMVRRGDVLAAWSGIRPLVINPKATDTQSVARNHIIDISQNKLVTIAGGKWTTYRSMAKDTMDAAVETCGLEPRNESLTDGLILEGGHGWGPASFIRLVQDFGLENEVAQHLSNTYGDKAFEVAKMAMLTGKRWPVVGTRLAQDFPYIEAEFYAVRKEYAQTVIDVIARRTRLAFLNVQATEEALHRISDIMGQELNWSKAKKEEEIALARQFLNREMGFNCRTSLMKIPINFTEGEAEKYKKRFRTLDSHGKGFITPNDLRQFLEAAGETVDEDALRSMLNEVDANKNGRLEEDEFLQLMSAIKTGAIANVRLESALSRWEQKSISPQIAVGRCLGLTNLDEKGSCSLKCKFFSLILRRET
ncbi:putative glycerol-3-phosphate dehydrogenase, mitochondrial isoform X1 [Apostichopus japonicus]|uniref:glycerol-3-phosphate dehydrogenase n=1 Tax=Stichopus japonicus TaxID=307972 RepID=A0A2G8LLD6_STIJA|nr:putative glycerol-3-phosphate dehydrogenase, mitochondrial isoform X1 [Apostichopus japonicus]